MLFFTILKKKSFKLIKYLNMMIHQYLYDGKFSRKRYSVKQTTYSTYILYTFCCSLPKIF